jgi:hypothetical protein
MAVRVRHMRELLCHRARTGVPHKPHAHRSVITTRFVYCPGGPVLRWEGDDA